MTDTVISKTITLSASRDVVWQFLTNKDKLGEWFHPAEADLEANQDYALVSKGEDGSSSNICWGKVLEMDMPNRLVYTLTIKPLGGAMTTVTWTLEEAQQEGQVGTKLSLVHEGIGEAAGEAAAGLFNALNEGWDKHLANLTSAIA